MMDCAFCGQPCDPELAKVRRAAFDALNPLVMHPDDRISELAVAARRSLAEMRLSLALGDWFRVGSNPRFAAHPGCYDDWRHDQDKEGPAPGDLDPIDVHGYLHEQDEPDDLPPDIDMSDQREPF